MTAITPIAVPAAPFPAPIEGDVLLLGADVNTDELHPSSFYALDDDRVRAGFLQAVPGRMGDPASYASGRIVVAGSNLGCGSSRETGARVFKLCGVRAVLATSFARIFQRNLINLGVPALTCPDLASYVVEREHILVDPVSGVVKTAAGEYQIAPLDPAHRSILEAGGLLAWLGAPR